MRERGGEDEMKGEVDRGRADRVKDDKVSIQREAKKMGKTGRQREREGCASQWGKEKANDGKRREEERPRCKRTRGEAWGNEVLMIGVGEEERGEVKRWKKGKSSTIKKQGIKMSEKSAETTRETEWRTVRGFIDGLAQLKREHTNTPTCRHWGSEAEWHTRKQKHSHDCEMRAVDGQLVGQNQDWCWRFVVSSVK